ncbi:MAG TPA: histidine kinase [Puia sp.]|nr:histidine kinase [Puia sp.]
MARRSRVRYYILFLSAFSIFWFLFKLGGIPDGRRALTSTALDVVLTGTALVTVVEWMLPELFYKRRYKLFGWGVASIVLAGGTLNILGQLGLAGMSLASYGAAMAKYREHFFYWFWSDLVAGSYFMIGVIVSGGVAVRLAFDHALQDRRLAVLESEKLRSELEALKNRINPHFIFNALNTIYYSIDSSNRNARSLTERFASMLRYQLYECNEERVNIEREVGFLENYISLQRERTGDGVTVRCRGLDELTGFDIPPHLLMPLVENCFKHVSRHPGRQSFIEISGEYRDASFLFQTRNSYDAGKAGDLSGIGLLLTRRRLELLGSDKGRLMAIPAEDTFCTTLTLDLS